jgi:hypothetical protein
MRMSCGKKIKNKKLIEYSYFFFANALHSGQQHFPKHAKPSSAKPTVQNWMFQKSHILRSRRRKSRANTSRRAPHNLLHFSQRHILSPHHILDSGKRGGFIMFSSGAQKDLNNELTGILQRWVTK